MLLGIGFWYQSRVRVHEHSIVPDTDTGISASLILGLKDVKHNVLRMDANEFEETVLRIEEVSALIHV